MRILLCGGKHPDRIGGGTVGVHGLASALRDRGHDVTLLFAAERAHQVALPGIRSLYVDVTQKSLYPLLLALRPLGRYDAIHAWDDGSPFFALRARLERLPCVVQLQPPRVRTENLWKAHWRWRYIEMGARLARLLVTPSQWLADGIAERFALPPERFRVIPIGIAAHWYDAYLGAMRPPNTPLRVVLVNMKGVDVALRAFAKVVREVDARLELYGVSKNPDADRALVAELGIGERVRFEGFVPNAELPKRLAGADVFVHPTRGESFGQVLGEAAALGIPMISTRMTAVPELVVDGQTGLLCSLDDVDAFSVALSTLLRDFNLRARMGEAARARALALWRWERVVERYEQDVYPTLHANVQRAAL
jgi:glycosyltransferase involved in cell wall biosynthesis